MRYFWLMVLCLVSPVLLAQPVGVTDLSVGESLELLGTMAQRHPGFHLDPQYFSNYPSNPLLLLNGIVEAERDIPEALRKLEMPSELAAARVEYDSFAESGTYDAENLNKLREKIMEGFRVVAPLLAEMPFRSLAEVLAALPSDDKAAAALMKVAPLIWDAEGEPLFEYQEAKRFKDLFPHLISSIDQKSGGELDAMYTDIFLVHQKSIFTSASGFWAMRVGVFQKQFIERVLKKELRISRELGVTAIRHRLALVELPAVLTPLRSRWDCSARYVPYFGLAKGVRVFRIFPEGDLNAQPIGYALVADAERESGKIPYVVTINGELDADGARATLYSLGRMLGGNEVAAPDFAVNRAVVNGNIVKRGMRGGKKISLKLPDSWAAVYRQNKTRLQDFSRGTSLELYNPENLTHARLLKISDDDEIKLISVTNFVTPNPYVAPRWKNMPALDRLYVAAQVLALGKIANTSYDKELHGMELSFAEKDAAEFLEYVFHDYKTVWRSHFSRQIVDIAGELHVSVADLIRKIEQLYSPFQMADQMGEFISDYFEMEPAADESLRKIARRQAEVTRQYLQYLVTMDSEEHLDIPKLRILKFLPVDPLDLKEGFLAAKINDFPTASGFEAMIRRRRKYQIIQTYLGSMPPEERTRELDKVLTLLEKDEHFVGLDDVARQSFLSSLTKWMSPEQFESLNKRNLEPGDKDRLIFDRLERRSRNLEPWQLREFAREVDRHLSELATRNHVPEFVRVDLWNAFYQMSHLTWDEETTQIFERFYDWTIRLNPQGYGMLRRLEHQPVVSPARRERLFKIFERYAEFDEAPDYEEDRKFIDREKNRILSRLEKLETFEELSAEEREEIWGIVKSNAGEASSRHKSVSDFYLQIREAYGEFRRRTAPPEPAEVKTPTVVTKCDDIARGKTSLVDKLKFWK